MSKKVLILTGDAVDCLEVFYPYYRCLEEQIDVTIASPTKKKLQTVCHDFLPQMETFTELTAYRIDSHASVDDINPADFDALIIPGGRAPEYIRMNKSAGNYGPLPPGKQADGRHMPRSAGVDDRARAYPGPFDDRLHLLPS